MANKTKKLPIRRSPRTGLAVFPAPPERVRVHMDCGTHTVICPLIGWPDMVKIAIEYRTVEGVLETQALWKYLISLRTLRIAHEFLAVKITEDLEEVLSEQAEISVTITYVPRGGITVTATVER